MVTLVCALVGVKGNAFPVDIEASQLVGHLKKAIKKENEKTITCDARELQLFLAKKGDDTWLESSTDDVKKLKKGEKTDLIEALTHEDNELDGEFGLDEVLEGMPEPKTKQIHVLAVVTPHDDLRSPAMTLLEAIVPQVLTHAPTTLTERNRDFKDNLCKFYGCYSRKKSWVRCMLLDVAFPKSLVIASHLFRRSNEYLSLVMMQISDIDDVKNGLLLFKPLEYAFDHFQISFIRDDTDAFRLKLFDPSIRGTCLIDFADRNGNKVFSAEQTRVLLSSVSLSKKPCRFDVRTTFGDVDGTALTFTGLERPFYRCLNLQARVARMVALKKNWIDASYDFKDFWSEVSLDDKMEMFHRSILNADVACFD
jgi:hypothetical protein